MTARVVAEAIPPRITLSSTPADIGIYFLVLGILSHLVKTASNDAN
jgi:hypothetical protein